MCIIMKGALKCKPSAQNNVPVVSQEAKNNSHIWEFAKNEMRISGHNKWYGSFAFCPLILIHR